MTKPEKGVSQLRKGRISLAGTAYFITKNLQARLREDQPFSDGLLTNEGVAEIIINSLRFFENKGNIEVIAYVVMPDHLHLAFVLKEAESLSTTLERFFSYTSHAINKLLDRKVVYGKLVTTNEVYEMKAI